MLPPGLREVIDYIVKMIKAIKSSVLNTCLFCFLCQELDADDETFPFEVAMNAYVYTIIESYEWFYVQMFVFVLV